MSQGTDDSGADHHQTIEPGQRWPGRYNSIVEDHFQHPRNLGSLEDCSSTAEVSNPVCGDRLRLYLQMDTEGVCVERATFEVQGCPAAVAAGSMMTLLLQGAEIGDARAITNKDVERALGGLPRGKLHCSVLVEEAIRIALDRWELKRTQLW